MMNNKWKHGKAHFELGGVPSALTESHGIRPIPIILDDSVGEEIALLITEPASKAHQFSDRDITRFMLKTGLVNTTYGPVCFLLFYFPAPYSETLVAYEATVNPKDLQHLSIYKQLSNQQYWHVIIADDSGNVINFFEFPNQYGLKDTIDQVKAACENLEVLDFMQAKSEYEDRYTIDQLLKM